MRFDIREERENTLRRIKKREKTKCWILIFVLGLYITVSLIAYGNARQGETSTNKPLEHFIKAVTWNY